ncbi:hypothetical protein M8J76_011586 [Diaphorina citri]|nr:hypothetical protein M8J76_011586 [Diaphorina citri]
MKPKKSSKYWKKKLKQMKTQIKEIVYENAALCDYTYDSQMKYIQVCQEVQLLLKRLQRFEPVRFKDEKPALGTLSLHAGGSHSQPSNSSESLSPCFKKPAPKKRSNSEDTKSSSSSTTSSNTPSPKPRKSSGNQSTPVVKKKKICHQIRLDSSGQPVFPIELGTFTVHSLGEISGTAGFNTSDIIFPIGYCSTRIYASTRNPKQECLYICLIKEFEISADNEPHMPIVGTSPDECHFNLLQRLSISRVQPKGIDFFGLSHPTIHYLIQSSPNAKKCANYVFTKFEMGKISNEETGEKSSEANDFKLNHKAFLKHIQLIEASNTAKTSK